MAIPTFTDVKDISNAIYGWYRRSIKSVPTVDRPSWGAYNDDLHALHRKVKDFVDLAIGMFGREEYLQMATKHLVLTAIYCVSQEEVDQIDGANFVEIYAEMYGSPPPRGVLDGRPVIPDRSLAFLGAAHIIHSLHIDYGLGNELRHIGDLELRERVQDLLAHRGHPGVA